VDVHAIDPVRWRGAKAGTRHGARCTRSPVGPRTLRFARIDRNARRIARPRAFRGDNGRAFSYHRIGEAARRSSVVAAPVRRTARLVPCRSFALRDPPPDSRVVARPSTSVARGRVRAGRPAFALPRA